MPKTEPATTADAAVVQDEDRAIADKLIGDLIAMSRKANEQGHSLVDVLVKSAHDSFGIDIRPDEPAPEEPAA